MANLIRSFLTAQPVLKPNDTCSLIEELSILNSAIVEDLVEEIFTHIFASLHPRLDVLNWLLLAIALGLWAIVLMLFPFEYMYNALISLEKPIHDTLTPIYNVLAPLKKVFRAHFVVARNYIAALTHNAIARIETSRAFTATSVLSAMLTTAFTNVTLAATAALVSATKSVHTIVASMVPQLKQESSENFKDKGSPEFNGEAKAQDPDFLVARLDAFFERHVWGPQGMQRVEPSSKEIQKKRSGDWEESI